MQSACAICTYGLTITRVMVWLSSANSSTMRDLKAFERRTKKRPLGLSLSGKPVLSGELCPHKPITHLVSKDAYRKYLEYYNVPPAQPQEVLSSPL